MDLLLGTNIDRLRKATKNALSRSSKITGNTPVVRNLKMYQNMDEQTLAELGRRYGQSNLLRYIQHMEALRLKNGNS